MSVSSGIYISLSSPKYFTRLRQVAHTSNLPISYLDYWTRLVLYLLITRFADAQFQPVLSRKHASILFLYSLASSSVSQSSAPSLLPSLVPPPLSRPTASPITADPPVDTRYAKGRTKADILREYRTKTGKDASFYASKLRSFSPGRATIPEHLLLRDTLYLLQGISGKYVRFSLQNDEENKLVFVEDSVRAHPLLPISANRRAEIHDIRTSQDTHS